LFIFVKYRLGTEMLQPPRTRDESRRSIKINARLSNDSQQVYIEAAFTFNPEKREIVPNYVSVVIITFSFKISKNLL
jgi:hypothetical protein